MTAGVPAAPLRNNGRRTPGEAPQRMTDQPAATITAAEIAHSQQRWRHQRDSLTQHLHDLTLALDHLYPADCRVAGTLLMARPEWCPARPVPLADVALDWRAGPRDTPGAAALRPPRLLANRTCYRLLAAHADAGDGAPGDGARLEFGVGQYFDLINVSEAVAHEAAARTLSQPEDP